MSADWKTRRGAGAHEELRHRIPPAEDRRARLRLPERPLGQRRSGDETSALRTDLRGPALEEPRLVVGIPLEILLHGLDLADTEGSGIFGREF